MKARTLWALFALAFVARMLYAVWAEPEPIMTGLTRNYQGCTEHLLSGEGFVLRAETARVEAVPFVERFPGYILVLAVLNLVFGTGTLGLTAGHALIASAQAPVLAALGARLSSPAVGLWAGLIFALFPPLWRSDVQLLATGACGLALAATWLQLVRQLQEPTRWGMVGLAFLAASGPFLRPDNLPVPPLVALVLLAWPGFDRRRLLGVVLVLLVPLVFLSAWGVRNGHVTGEGFFISAGLGNNLLQGYGEMASGPDAPQGDANITAAEGELYLNWPHPKTRDRARKERALELIRANPGTWLKGWVRRGPILLSMYTGELWPGGPGLKEHVRAWRVRNPEQPRFAGLLRAAGSYLAAHPLRAALTLGWTPVFWLLVLGGAWAWRSRLLVLGFVLLVPAQGFFLHLPLHAEPRYFLPCVGLAALLAAVFVVRLTGRGGFRPSLNFAELSADEQEAVASRPEAS